MAETAIEEAVKKAKAGEPVTITPRELLSWVGASRRGINVVSQLRRKMEEAKVTTEPDFEGVYIDSDIKLQKVKTVKTAAAKKQVGSASTTAEAPSTEVSTENVVEPAHRISRLQAANRPPTMVSRDDSIQHAITLMLQNEFSQIPVKKGTNQLAGMISWRSICKKLHFADGCQRVGDCVEKHHEVRNSASLFDVIPIVTRHDCVIVKNGTGKITGLVTNADISREFRNLTEPFLLLGEIENALRRLIDQRFPKDKLENARDPNLPPRPIESASDLTFGEHLRLMENSDNWNQLGLPLERSAVVKQLEEIRQIRNDVMHFDPDPLDDKSKDELRSSAHFLSGLLDTIG